MKWDVFISHASEDKEAFARPLANGLAQYGIKVWFDEFTLTVGDSLRRSIDQGLAHSRFGIVLISRPFLQKEWPQKELDGLVSRETGGVKVILPVWHEIDVAEIRSRSPLLADRLAVSSDKGLDHVIAELRRAIQRDNPIQIMSAHHQPSGQGDDEVLGRNHLGNAKFVMLFRGILYLRAIPTAAKARIAALLREVGALRPGVLLGAGATATLAALIFGGPLAYLQIS